MQELEWVLFSLFGRFLGCWNGVAWGLTRVGGLRRRRPLSRLQRWRYGWSGVFPWFDVIFVFTYWRGLKIMLLKAKVAYGAWCSRR